MTEENAIENVKEKKTPGRPPLLPDDDFRRVWEAASSLDEVVQVLFPDAQDYEKKKTYCSLRASRLRKKLASNSSDLTLKEFSSSRKKVAEVQGTPTE